MKKLLFLLSFTLVSSFSAHIVSNSSEPQYSRFSTSLSAGYVFKNDCTFKAVYGRGLINAVTADFCYYPWDNWGIGAKISYWRNKGRTTFLNQCTLMQEVPTTVFVRGRKNFDCGLQIYGSAGAGFVWLKEKSYLGCLTFYQGIGEVELGLQYKVWRHINLLGAVRYLFPRKTCCCEKIDVGGVDLRAGIGFEF